MDFKSIELSVLAYANNFTLWHYNHQGNHADVIEPGFFDKAADNMLRENDLILINCKDANTSVWVTSVLSGKVEVKENLIPSISGE